MENDTQPRYQVSLKIRETVMHHPNFSLALKAVQDALESSKRANIQQNLLLVGHSGVGKTTVMETISKQSFKEFREDRTLQEVISVTVPSSPTVKSLAAAVLLELGDPSFARGTAEEKTSRIIHFAHQKSVKLIFFDEIQHFVDQSNRTTQSAVTDWFKVLVDKLKISTVLIGLPRSEGLLQLNEQLRRRFSQLIVLPPFKLESTNDLKLFINVISTFIQRAALQSKFELSHEIELVKRIYYASNGIIDYVGKLLIGASELSEQRHVDVLSLGILEDAFTSKIWHEGVGQNNPFSQKFKMCSLTKPGMPFH